MQNNGKPKKEGMETKSRWRTYQIVDDHIDEAIKQGFFIEALEVEERLVADRLGSGARWKGFETTGRKVSLGKLIGLVRQHPGEFRELHERLKKKGLAIDDVDAWRRERNRFLHNVARGLPGQEAPMTADEYNARGTAAAERGLELARAVCAWYKSELSVAPEQIPSR